MAKVKLKIKGKDEMREFEKVHAISLLNFRNSCFELPDDSPFEFLGNELKRKTSTTANTKKSSKRKSGISPKA